LLIYLSYNVLETVHRINVGGMKLTPFNDTLWRTWIPHKDFLVFNVAAALVTQVTIRELLIFMLNILLE
jgi:hypothetical protein